MPNDGTRKENKKQIAPRFDFPLGNIEKWKHCFFFVITVNFGNRTKNKEKIKEQNTGEWAIERKKIGNFTVFNNRNNGSCKLFKTRHRIRNTFHFMCSIDAMRIYFVSSFCCHFCFVLFWFYVRKLDEILTSVGAVYTAASKSQALLNNHPLELTEISVFSFNSWVPCPIPQGSMHLFDIPNTDEALTGVPML